MLSGFQGSDSEGRVLVVVDADIYGVNIIARQQILEVRVSVGNIKVLPGSFDLLREKVADGNDLDFRYLAVVLKVLGRDLACANHTDANWFFHESCIFLEFLRGYVAARYFFCRFDIRTSCPCPESPFTVISVVRGVNGSLQSGGAEAL